MSVLTIKQVRKCGLQRSCALMVKVAGCPKSYLQNKVGPDIPENSNIYNPPPSEPQISTGVVTHSSVLRHYAAAVHTLVSTYPASSYLSSRPRLLYFSRFAHSIKAVPLQAWTGS